MTKEIGLALGGGGARGFAHLGVLHILEKSGFTVKAIAGTSAGSIVGSLVAAGFSHQAIRDELESIEPSRLFMRKPDDEPSILGLWGLEEKLRALLGERRFADLELPFATVAVDFYSGEIKVFNEGDVVDAVMASSAVPGFFPPKYIDGRLFMDGGVLLPVPVTPVKQMALGLPVIAVALSPSLDEWGNFDENFSLIKTLPVLQRFVERSRVARSINHLLTAVELGNARITDLSLEKDPPDILIRPRVYTTGFLEQSGAEPLITSGEDAALESLDNIRRVVSWRGKLARIMISIRNL